MQSYVYYHLGQAYFAKHDYAEAARWFERANGVIPQGGDNDMVTANTYWIYLSLARGGRMQEAQEALNRFTLTLADLPPNTPNIFYFDGVQLFKGHRRPDSFFPGGDLNPDLRSAANASMSYTLAQYYLLQGEREQARPWLARAIQAESWGMFARIQAEADWMLLFPGQQPQQPTP